MCSKVTLQVSSYTICVKLHCMCEVEVTLHMWSQTVRIIQYNLKKLLQFDRSRQWHVAVWLIALQHTSRTFHQPSTCNEHSSSEETERRVNNTSDEQWMLSDGSLFGMDVKNVEKDGRLHHGVSCSGWEELLERLLLAFFNRGTKKRWAEHSRQILQSHLVLRFICSHSEVTWTKHCV